MGAQRLLSKDARRKQILECISLIEQKKSGRTPAAAKRLLHALRMKADWLQAVIDSERQQSDAMEIKTVAKVPRATDAA